jgi:hypothetical protein
MKLVSYLSPSGEERVGLCIDGQTVDLAQSAAGLGLKSPSTMTALLNAGDTIELGITGLGRLKNRIVLAANDYSILAKKKNVPSANDIAIFQASIVPLEGDEAAFFRFQRHRDCAEMLGVGLHIAQSDQERAAMLVMLSAKCALDCDDVDFGWKAAFIVRRLSH